MTCDRFEEGLGDLLEGSLPETERLEMEEHRRGCGRCRALAEALRRADAALEGWPAETGAAAPDLVEAVMARTTGRACGAAREELAAGWGAVAGGADGELLRLHLARCAGCREAGVVLGWLREELPGMAEADPGDAFAARAVRRAREAAPQRWWAGLRGLAEAALRRPRFAWEAAYVGAMLLALVVATPGSPFAQVPARALELASGNPVRAAGTALAPLARGAQESAESAWRAAWEATGGRLERAGDETPDSIPGRIGWAWVSGRSFVGNAYSMCLAYVEGDRARAGDCWRDMGADLKSAWRAISGGRREPAGRGKNDGQRT